MREERREEREGRREKSAERSEKREEITKKAARDPQMRLLKQQQLIDSRVCTQRFGPRRAGWQRKGSAPRREEGRAKREARRGRQARSR